MKKYTVEDFFNKKFEIESTRVLNETPSFFSSSLVKDYVGDIMSYGLNEYIQYIIENPIQTEITSRDITQLSSIADCTCNMCEVMIECNNRGLTLTEIAKGLHADNNYKDNPVALTKYGENQAKTAQQFGLVIYSKDLWYLTAIGNIFPELSTAFQNKYLSIVLLRDPFYSQIIISLIEKDTNIKDYMSILSVTTQKRRTSSCNRTLSFFLKQCDMEGVKLHNLLTK